MAHESPFLPRYQRDGVTLGAYFGVRLPEHFGDVAAEYRAAREAAVLFDVNYLCFAELSGPDRMRYLNAVVSNNLAELQPGQGAVALLLNPQGHILAELECYVLDDRFLIATHAVTAQRTLQTLEKFIIMDDATLEDVTPRYCAFAVEGPRAADAVAGYAPYQHTAGVIGGVPCRITRRSYFGAPGFTVVAARDQSQTLWAALESELRAKGGRPIGYAALNALRLEAGVPWFSHDFDDKVIPHEAALETTHISFTKGCYTGQEIVERVRSRGQVNRRRVSLLFDGATPPAPGEKLLASGKEAGHVTGAAFSPGLNAAVGMGYLRREHNTPGSAVEWSGGTARVVEPPVRGGA